MPGHDDRVPVALGDVRRPRVPPTDEQRAARQDRMTREAIFLAAGGKGPHRLEAFPIVLDSPFDEPRLAPWDPADYTLRMIRHSWPVSSERLLSESDWRSLRAILDRRVDEIRDELAKRTSPRHRSLALPVRKALPAAKGSAT
jgi:hypothetical protein